MFNEKFRRYGATLSTITALGGVGVTAAEASPDHPESTINAAAHEKEPKSVPDGVKALVTEAAIQKDLAECLPRVNKQWDGVLVLHDTKKSNVMVSFATSPKSYTAESSDFIVGTNKKPVIYLVIPKPAIVKCDNRDYAVISDVKNGGTYGFLDIKYAEEVGALDSYAFKGVRPKANHHTYSSETNDLPFVYSSEAYSPQWSWSRNKQTLTSITLPTNQDPHPKLYKLTPSSVVPHA